VTAYDVTTIRVLFTPMSESPLRAVGTDADEHPFTIERLAAETGMTVRNIRSHRARNLLQAPVVRDRVGYYGAEHVERLRLIRELQAEGFNLAAIKRLVDGPTDQIVSALHLVQEPFETEQPQVVTLEELRGRFAVDAPEPLLAKAEELGILLPLGGGRFEAPAPSLLDVAEELVQRGVPLHHALAVVAKVRESCRTVARQFIRLFVEDVFRPFEAEGMPAARWPQIVEAIERLRPMSAQVVLSVYQLTMTGEVERATTREFARLLKGGRGGRVR
jgi:DNA-binding transcriptional MerR regulator